jgi:hypothetical protein
MPIVQVAMVDCVVGRRRRVTVISSGGLLVVIHQTLGVTITLAAFSAPVEARVQTDLLFDGRHHGWFDGEIENLDAALVLRLRWCWCLCLRLRRRGR